MSKSQTDYEQYQARKDEVRAWGHRAIQQIHDDIRRKIEALWVDFHSHDEKVEAQP